MYSVLLGTVLVGGRGRKSEQTEAEAVWQHGPAHLGNSIWDHSLHYKIISIQPPELFGFLTYCIGRDGVGDEVV